MNIKLIQNIGLCLIAFFCNNSAAMQPIKKLTTFHSGMHCLHKMTPVVHGPQTKVSSTGNVIKLGASFSTLAVLCHIGYWNPATKK